MNATRNTVPVTKIIRQFTIPIEVPVNSIAMPGSRNRTGTGIMLFIMGALKILVLTPGHGSHGSELPDFLISLKGS